VRDALGQLYLQLGDGKRALEQFEAIVKIEPRAALTRHTLGFLYRSKGESDLAKREFRACIQIEPGWTEPYKSLAMLLVEEGHLDSALAVYNVALAVDSTDASIHNNVGFVYSLAKKWPDAKLAYRNAIEFTQDPAMLRDVQKNLSTIVAIEAGKVQVRHVIVRTAAKAAELLAQLNAGSDFAELAREHSIDASAREGGNLGFFQRGDLHPDFEAAAFALEVGDLSEVIQTPVGFHIIQRTN
jgi:parvulin-like peptidyl-prolyl isomerase